MDNYAHALSQLMDIIGGGGAAENPQKHGENMQTGPRQLLDSYPG